MRLFALTLLGVTFEIRLGNPSSEDPSSPSPVVVDGSYHYPSSDHSRPYPLGFSLPSVEEVTWE